MSPLVSIKGPVWAQVLYGDIGRRSWSDLDLLVDEDQAVLAREVLLAGGFTDSGPFNERMLPASSWGERVRLR